ncbi:MAG: hypothetical protein OXF27_00875 [Acidobacteria bacterium]|nr:hypothetical protein [Acidobacteriota bacterium]
MAERRARLDQRVEESGVSELFGAVRDMFRANWPDSKMHPRAYGLSIKLQRQSYARIDLWQAGHVWIVFQPSAKALCPNEFERPLAAIPHGTWPHGRDALADADAAVQFKLTHEDWEKHKETLTRLAQAIYEAYKAQAAR